MKVRAIMEGRIIMYDVEDFAKEHNMNLGETQELIRQIARILQITSWISFQEWEET